MAKPYYFLNSLLLRFTKGLMGFVFVTSGFLALLLIGRTYEAATTPEVRLRLDTMRPNLLGFWHDAQAGYADGKPGGSRREERGPLASLQPAAGFELAADPHLPLLRYREPSPAKRAALLALGALDDSLSVVGVLFLAGTSWLLFGLLREVAAGTPFTPANARRLAWLALLLLVLNLWHYVAYALVWALVPPYRVAGLAHPLSHYVRPNTDELVPGFEVGFILFVIAVVYRRGVELSREAELVI